MIKRAASLAIAILTSSCGSPAASEAPVAKANLADSAPVLGGLTPFTVPGRGWRRHLTEVYCETRTDVTASYEIVAPDSADAVMLARRALGDSTSAMKVEKFVHDGSEGALVRLQQPSPPPDVAMLDGSATVYVDRSRCVTFLGV